MTPEAIKTQVHTFLAPRMPNYKLRDDENFFALGFVNSLFAIELVLFIEQNFGVRLSGADLDMDNLRTVDSIAALVMSK